MSRLYTFSSVLIFDRAFRTRVSNKEVQRWDYHDHELRSAYLIQLPRRSGAAVSEDSRGASLCWNCGLSGHYASRCPRTVQRPVTEPGDSQVPFRAPQRYSATRPATGSPSTRSANIPRLQRRRVCEYWNTEGGCAYQICRFDHRCNICQSQEHTALHCPTRHGEQ